jgi:hypothetical protein
MAAPRSATRGSLREYERRPTEGILPVPDPTRLTAELVDRSISAFREVFEVRLAEMDKAVSLAAQQMDKMSADDAAERNELRADVGRQMTALREFIMSQIENNRGVTAEKLEAINIRFAERDKRTTLAAEESRTSLANALAAAKEAVSEQNKANVQAVAKSEIATQKQIDAIMQLMTTSNKSLEDKIADIKTRLDRGEGRDTGSSQAHADRRLDVGSLLQALAVIAAIIGLILLAFHKP